MTSFEDPALGACDYGRAMYVAIEHFSLQFVLQEPLPDWLHYHFLIMIG
jgi:hypothetical protein